MKTEEKTKAEGVKGHVIHTGDAAVMAAEIAGAVVGSLAGPPGIVAGLVVGGLAGTVVGAALEAEEDRQRVHDEELDATIGVVGGDMGAVQPGPPPEGSAPPEKPMKDDKESLLD
jgi:hypothetical protein